jgi:hypothetical protein
VYALNVKSCAIYDDVGVKVHDGNYYPPSNPSEIRGLAKDVPLGPGKYKLQCVGLDDKIETSSLKTCISGGNFEEI